MINSRIIIIHFIYNLLVDNDVYALTDQPLLELEKITAIDAITAPVAGAEKHAAINSAVTPKPAKALTTTATSFRFMKPSWLLLAAYFHASLGIADPPFPPFPQPFVSY